MDVPRDMIAALALREDITNVQFKLEWVLSDRTDVLAHDDDHSSNGGSTIIPSPPGAYLLASHLKSDYFFFF